MIESSIKEYKLLLDSILNGVKKDPVPIFELSLWLLRKGEKMNILPFIKKTKTNHNQIRVYFGLFSTSFCKKGVA